MILNFPEKPEIRLRNSPLAEVICQVQFPPILRIAKETPDDLQESIRDRFPDLSIEQGYIVQLPKVGNVENPNVETPPRSYRFIRSEDKCQATLGIDFFSLSTKDYHQWKNFISDYQLLESAVKSIYQIPYAKRVGLRFINRFTLQNTISKNAEELISLFRKELTCLYKTDCWKNPEEMVYQIILGDNPAKLAIRIKYGSENLSPFFILDLDYFQEGKVELGKLDEILSYSHNRIYQAFRWCLIGQELGRFNPIHEKVI